jgi:hypothetical protein
VSAKIDEFRTCKGAVGTRIELLTRRGIDMLMQGTAFYALQSCMNHSDTPNALTLKDDTDGDGRAVITAACDIPAGAELCISYIDQDAPEKERLAALRDYGIVQ